MQHVIFKIHSSLDFILCVCVCLCVLHLILQPTHMVIYDNAERLVLLI